MSLCEITVQVLCYIRLIFIKLHEMGLFKTGMTESPIINLNKFHCGVNFDLHMTI